MIAKLEYLQSSKDIEEFVDFLYENELFISVQEYGKLGKRLNKMEAMKALISELTWSNYNYYVGNEKELVQVIIEPCDRDGHPRRLGKRGRMAGRILLAGETDTALNTMKLVYRYIRKNYDFQRYNGSAVRMSCWFGRHYQQLDEKYAESPEPEGLCFGSLRVFCMPEDKIIVEDRINQLIGKLDEAITNPTGQWDEYWKDNELLDFQMSFLYIGDRVKIFDLPIWAREIAGVTESMKVGESKMIMRVATYESTYDLKKKNGIIEIVIVLERPWQWWLKELK